MHLRTLLLRHGTYDRHSVHGELDYAGMEQMIRATSILASQKLGNIAIFSSEAPRGYQSGEIIAEGLGIKGGVILTPFLGEGYRNQEVLSNIDAVLLRDDALISPHDIRTIIAVSHEPTILAALRLSANSGNIPNVIPNASVHEFVPKNIRAYDSKTPLF